MRKSAVALARSQGNVRQTAERLGMSARTLSNWAVEWERTRLAPVERGRPAKRSPRAERQAVLAFIEEKDAKLGLGNLLHEFPNFPKREAASILSRVKRLRVRQAMRKGLRLGWLVPGTVWSMDHTQGPEGKHHQVLMVRDLGSRMCLYWRRTEGKTAEETAGILETLFREHGAPLVLKADNGGAGTGEETQEVLRRHGVILHLSPAYYPRYNGSTEKAIGWMKERTEGAAAAAGRPGRWGPEDYGKARLWANTGQWPWGLDGPTPEEAWRARSPVSAETRDAFGEAVRKAREEVECEAGEEMSSSLKTRRGIERALVRSGQLTVRRGRVSPPIPSRF